MERTLNLTIYLDDYNKYVTVDFQEPESGESSRIVVPFSPDKHPELNERIGNEIYSWITLWADEMDDGEDK